MLAFVVYGIALFSLASIVLLTWNEASRMGVGPMTVCPWCDTAIDRVEISLNENFSGDGFQMPCPHCERLIDVEVEIVDVEYDLSRAEDDEPEGM